MRYHEYAYLSEARHSEISSLPSTPDEAKNAMIDLVSVYRSRNETSIPMKEILGILHNQGFDANVRWVMDTLKDTDGVSRITPESVYLVTDKLDIGVTSGQEQDKSEEKVGKMAAKAAKKGIK